MGAELFTSLLLIPATTTETQPALKPLLRDPPRRQTCCASSPSPRCPQKFLHAGGLEIHGCERRVGRSSGAPHLLQGLWSSQISKYTQGQQIKKQNKTGSRSNIPSHDSGSSAGLLMSAELCLVSSVLKGQLLQ